MYSGKKLRRPVDRKMIAGVCAALADYFGLDVTVVRLAYVAISLITVFPGFVFYIIAWLVIPKEENNY
ncbi:MAG: PspC domain-containing protein [Bacteroidetes bacterium]|uniref:PspC domain-containing protein n=1 Tax=Candidatus Limisoma faecipullorum TaxID=2840854 RepID=A0A9D9IPB1_9BACT|nr:PspC domain-containing protein [Candidatus Limisoma faecipullorum]